MYRDTATYDKLIFPSAIMRILCHFSVLFPFSDHFSIVYAIDYATVKCSEAQFRLRQSDSAAPPSCSAPSRSAPSTFAPSSSLSDVSLGDVMAQLQCIDASLYTLSIELYQVNVHVGYIARRQVIMGRFAPKASLPPYPLVASDSEDEDDDDGDNDDASDDDDDEDVSSTNEMST